MQPSDQDSTESRDKPLLLDHIFHGQVRWSVSTSAVQQERNCSGVWSTRRRGWRERLSSLCVFSLFPPKAPRSSLTTKPCTCSAGHRPDSPGEGKAIGQKTSTRCWPKVWLPGQEVNEVLRIRPLFENLESFHEIYILSVPP